MPVSVGYITKEAGTNLWRNRLMTVAAVLTVAVSLALVGSALLMKQGATKATVRWQNNVDVIVWVKPSAGATTVSAVNASLHQSPYVKWPCRYRDQRYDYSEARTLEPADLWQATSLHDYPESYRCTLNDPSQAPAVAAQFTGKPGVYNVSYPGQQIKTMQSVIHVLQWVFLAVAVVLLLSASVLILNTIRIAIFARRREVSVMKLVGATNWFIRLPFMAEGLTQGLLGAGVAILVVLGLYYGLGLNAAKTATNAGNWLQQMGLSGWDVTWTCVLVTAVGVIVGALGSAMAVRRFLDV